VAAANAGGSSLVSVQVNANTFTTLAFVVNCTEGMVWSYTQNCNTGPPAAAATQDHFANCALHGCSSPASWVINAPPSP
jgi:hypothetical protein